MSEIDNESLKRVSSPTHHIDAGFLNRRKCLSVFGLQYAKAYESAKYPSDDHMSTLMNDHLLIHLALEWCARNKIPSLSELLSNPQEKKLFCSTENILGCGNIVYDCPRASNNITFPFETNYNVTIEYHTSHIYADTQRLIFSKGHKVSIIGEIFCIQNNRIIIHPLVVGPPTYDHPNNRKLPFDFLFDGWSHYQIYSHDIDQFSKCKDIKVTDDEWQNSMKKISEQYIKNAFCKLLSDATSKDWGGEQYDHFTDNITLNSMRKTGAFLFKGPSAWGEMKPKHLGKNGDQIYRLHQSNAEVLFVQHCHHIGEAVRDTLRAFSVKPSNPRHYCLIDGKDTYKILKAYNLLPHAT